MKVICDREKLREGLAIANSAVPGKPQKPILENLCLVAADDSLEIIGTDYDVSIRYAIDDVQVTETGPTVIPAKTLLDFVRDLSGETVTLESKDQKCTISSGTDTCELVTADPDEYPVVQRFEDSGTLSMQGGSFIRLVNQTSFAAAKEAGRYAMNGVLVDMQDDGLTMVATDGRRLALGSVPVEGARAGGDPAIVPTKAMQLFCRVIDDPLDQISIQFGEGQVSVRTKNAEIFARLIDGEYPRYSAVIPAETTHTMEADRELLEKKMRLVSNVAGDEARAVKLKVKSGQLELFGQSVGRGEATAHMEVDFKDGEADIAFNPDFVIDGLKHCQEETVRLEFNERTSPGKFRLGENYIYVVMPITVGT